MDITYRKAQIVVYENQRLYKVLWNYEADACLAYIITSKTCGCVSHSQQMALHVETYYYTCNLQHPNCYSRVG